MLRNYFKDIAKHIRKPALPESITTDGFEEGRGLAAGRLVCFAQATRWPSAQRYDIAFVKRGPPSANGYNKKDPYNYYPDPGPKGLSLHEALEELDSWQSQRAQTCCLRHSVTGRPHTVHYRLVAEQFGFNLGAQGASLRHALRMKRVATARRKPKA